MNLFFFSLTINWGNIYQILQAKKSDYLKKKQLAASEAESEVSKKQEKEKAQVKLEENKSQKPEITEGVGVSYGQSVGLKDDLDVDDDVGMVYSVYILNFMYPSP